MPVLNVDGIPVELSNLEKELWPDLSKEEVISYYIKVSSYLLPHLKDRPLVLTRYPDGIYGKSFYQKNIPETAPEWVATYPIYARHSRRTISYCVADKLATLVWLANLAVLEIHPYLSRLQRLHHPDFVVFDLDPMENSTWDDVCVTALVIRDALERLKLRGYPKTSGATGLQIYVPVENMYTYEEGRRFALTVAAAVNEALPEITSLERKIGQRGGRLYLDCLQNVVGKTLAGVYCLRPLPGAPVSTPVTWEEIAARSFIPADFNIFTIFERLQEKGDLFAPVLKDKQRFDHVLV